MKKRITALILVVVMSVLSLFGCGEYDYADADLNEFSSVNVAALKNALKNIVIDDEKEYSADKATRLKDKHDVILRSLLNAENADDTEYTDIVPDYADALYFCYYVVYTDGDGHKHVINAPKTSGKTDSAILPANKTYMQFGVDNSEDPLASAIEEAFANVNIKDYIYSLNKNEDASGTAGAGDLKVAEGNTVLLSFTHTAEDGTVKTVQNLMVAIPAAGAELDAQFAFLADEFDNFTDFLAALVGKNVGKKLVNTEENKFEYGETPVTYKDVTVVGVVEGKAEALSITYSDDAEKKLDDILGEKIDLKGKDVTCYVYPTHVKKVDYVKLDENSTTEDYQTNVKALLTVFYGSAVLQSVDENGKELTEKVGALPIFKSEEYEVTYKDGENDVTKTFKQLIEEFVDLQKAVETKKADYEKAEEAFEKALKAYNAAKKSYEDMLNVTIPKLEAEIAEIEALMAELEDLKANNASDDEIAVQEAKIQEKEKEYGTLDKLKEALEDAKLDLNGDENGSSDIEKKGFKGVYEEAETALVKACAEAFGHTDENADGKCDKCFTCLHTIDANEDGKCDNCSVCLHKTDADEDGKCDDENCGLEIPKKTEDTSKSKPYFEALEKRDSFINEKIFAATKKSDAEASLVKDIMSEFDESVESVLEDSYFEAIHAKIQKKVIEAILNNVSVDVTKLPSSAVDEIYEKLYEGHKYDFYNSASSTTASSNYYDQYAGDFEAYLMVKTGADSFKNAKLALEEEAKTYVVKIVKIYQAARALGLELTEEEFDAALDAEYKNQEMWKQLYEMYGLKVDVEIDEQSLHIGKQVDKLLNALFKVKEADGKRATYGEDKIYYEYDQIKYTVA